MAQKHFFWLIMEMTLKLWLYSQAQVWGQFTSTSRERKHDNTKFCLSNERSEDLVQNRFLEIILSDQNNQAISSSRSIPHLRLWGWCSGIWENTLFPPNLGKVKMQSSNILHHGGNISNLYRVVQIQNRREKGASVQKEFRNVGMVVNNYYTWFLFIESLH